MTLPLKKRVAKPVCRIDRKSQAVTANVDFEDIDVSIKNEGSEVYDYEFFVQFHFREIRMTCENLVVYSEDYMQGANTTASASTTASQAYISVGECLSSTFPTMAIIRITGGTGNKRHISVTQMGHDGSQKFIRKQSNYTADTSTEIKSIQFYSPTTASNIDYSIVGTAVPKVQYNPHAILLKDLTLSSQTADIIFGGSNDTEGVDDLDGDVYDYFVTSSNPSSSSYFSGFINEDTTSSRIEQRMKNSNGSISSANATNRTSDFFLNENAQVKISAEVGRKPIITYTNNRPVATQQSEYYLANPDTSTPMTSLMLRPSASVSGNIQLYAVRKGDNADLTPWTFRQVHSVSNASFAGGNTFEIPSWAMLARVQVIGYSASGSNIELDFDTTTVIDKQYLKSSTSSTTASFATNRTIGKVDKVSNIDCIVSLKSGTNRPILSKSNYNENTIDINGLWAKNSSSNYTQLILNADNANLMDAEISVSFY